MLREGAACANSAQHRHGSHAPALGVNRLCTKTERSAYSIGARRGVQQSPQNRCRHAHV